jgi:putative cell wall-binding protein
VCVGIDRVPNGSPFALDLVWSGASNWFVDPGASAAGNSAAAGPGTIQGIGSSVLRLPVQQSSNKVPTLWRATGLTLAGTAYTDGPVFAYVWWVNGQGEGCDSVAGHNKDDNLGYVQLTTVSELAPAVFGADAEATAANAINHQFDYHKSACIGNGILGAFSPIDNLPVLNNFFGPSIFLARSDHFADGLGAAYAAGSVNSGVALTPPNSIHPLTADVIRLQGAQTVFVAGGPLAISDAVVDQLRDTPSYVCGGTIPRVDPLTGKLKNLNVIRIFGNTLYDTNERLAEFTGAQPPEALPALLAGPVGNPYNETSGNSAAGPVPGGTVNTALLVTGENFQDAIVGSVPAYGGGFGTLATASPVNGGFNAPMPLIATKPGGLSPQALNAMFNQHIGQVILLGGPLAVSDTVMADLAAAGIRVVRVAGVDNTDTASQFAQFALSTDNLSPAGNNGLGWFNVDFFWNRYVNRTAGSIGANDNEQVTAHVALLTRGDYFADGMAAAAVLSVHNGYWHCTLPSGIFDEIHGDDCVKFPLLMSTNPSTLGAATTGFLNKAGLALSGLKGAIPAAGQFGGMFAGTNLNDFSSSVFTIQPIGGPVALTPGLLSAAVAAVTAG